MNSNISHSQKVHSQLVFWDLRKLFTLSSSILTPPKYPPSSIAPTQKWLKSYTCNPAIAHSTPKTPLQKSFHALKEHLQNPLKPQPSTLIPGFLSINSLKTLTWKSTILSNTFPTSPNLLSCSSEFFRTTMAKMRAVPPSSCMERKQRHGEAAHLLSVQDGRYGCKGISDTSCNCWYWGDHALHINMNAIRIDEFFLRDLVDCGNPMRFWWPSSPITFRSVPHLW